jgi:glycosyltransferase involved in cell wall biosynthesis
MKIVVITQQVDPAHPALAATVPKIAALARLSSEVTVLADTATPNVLPPNVRIRPFGARTKIARALRFEAALTSELAARPRPAAVLAHMCPIYAVLAAPLARPLRVPVALWYTHWHASATLRLAARLSNIVLTVDRRSFPLRSQKVHPIGHGVDVAAFRCRRANESGGGLRALALGRYSPAKGLEVVLRAVSAAQARGADVRLDVHGPALNRMEQQHRSRMSELVDALGLAECVRLGDAVDRRNLSQVFAAHDVLVNNMRPGAPDKVVYEAAAACLPVLASNPVFDTLLDERLRFEPDDAAALADRLVEFSAIPEAARAEIGRTLRERVVGAHSVEHWAEQVVTTVRRA